MDSSEPREKPIRSPDVIVEHGSSRLSLDLSAFEWFMLTIIVAIVGATVYFLNK